MTMRRLLTSSLAVVALCCAAGGAGDAAGQSVAIGAIEVSPIKAVILADESGSLDAAAVTAEQNAAAILAASELSSGSAFEIVGFGSSNQPGQSAVKVYCEFTRVSDAAARDRLASCAKRIHRRAPAEGNDTDHAAALQSAVDALSRNTASADSVIFLLTDGVLDVSNSPQYGKSGPGRTAEALRQIREQILPAARQAGIQIWPLGFGEVDAAALEAFARGGAGPNQHCSGVPGARPHGVVVGTSTEVIVGLLTTLGRARCAQVNPPTSGVLAPGKTLTLKVQIPAVATDGAITVTKIDPSFRVDYFDPHKHQAPKQGQIEDQTFERSGESNQVEALRIRNPIPGVWKVKVSAPSTSHAQTVTATAVWQGALEGSVTLVPAQPKPGKSNRVEVTLKTRNGLINDPSALKGIRAEAFLKSESTGRLAIPLRDDGNGGDAKAHDGVFSGSFPVPVGAEGACAVIGVISGVGLASDRRPYGCEFWQQGSPEASFGEFSLPATLHAGDSVHGDITTHNEGPAARATLVLSGLSAGALVSVAPTTVLLPSGTGKTSFTLHVDKNTPKGEITGQLQVLDSERRVIAAAPLYTTVTTPPGILSRFWWVLVVLFALALAAVGALKVRRDREVKAARVNGLVAKLYRNGEEVSSLNAPVVGDRFPVDVVDDPDNPRIRTASNGEATLIIKRTDGAVTVEGPNQPMQKLEFGDELSVAGLALVVRDNLAAGGTNSRKTREQVLETQSTTGGSLISGPTAAADEDDLN